ncbi:MAG: Jag N-terminal domain-containing protein [Oscillospiraceae bacterium]|jgi:spoIIIJ-associated protein|nr:Jag N-terminal domain-containing protein [Oscillospiraceae bacterium]
MLREAIGTGATVEAAIDAAKLELNAPDDAELQTEILETPTRKTLGLFGGTPAKVRVYFDESEFARAENYLRSILCGMGVQANVLTVKEDEGVRFALDCPEDEGYVIGRRGETLDALQYLTRLVVSRGAEQYQRVSVNVGDYREQREQTLLELAEKQASKAKKFGHNVSLAPMSAYDRRIVHTAVQATEGVSSFSVGEGGERHIVIAPDEQYRKPGKPGGNYNNNRGGNHRFNDNRREGGNRGNQSNSGYRSDRNDRYGDRPQRDNDANRYNRPDRTDRPGGDFHRSSDDVRRASNPPAQVNRTPRSDSSGAGRYGKIERKESTGENE